jgi:hypothetical protein
MARTRKFIIRKLTLELDELANKWNKTRDPSIRDQWFKKVSQVQPLVSEEEQLSSHKKI